MRFVFIGTGSAFTVGGNYQSNMYFEDDTGRRLLIDCGGDVRHGLHDLGLSYGDFDDIYISHLHADHIGGLEWLAFSRLFDPKTERPRLFCADSLVDPLWKGLAGGLRSLDTVEAQLSTYFDVGPVKDGGSFRWNELEFEIFPTIHQISNHQLMPCFGLQVTINSKVILITTDTRIPTAGDTLMERYQQADLIFQDCETSAVKSTVHAHYTELLSLDVSIRQKMWLYHYQQGPLPDAKQAGFRGFVQKGQCFTL